MAFYTALLYLYGSFVLISGLIRQVVLWNLVFSSSSWSHIPFMVLIIHTMKISWWFVKLHITVLSRLKFIAYKTWRFFQIQVVTLKPRKIIKEMWEAIRPPTLHSIWITLAFLFLFFTWMFYHWSNTFVNKFLMENCLREFHKFSRFLQIFPI